MKSSHLILIALISCLLLVGGVQALVYNDTFTPIMTSNSAPAGNATTASGEHESGTLPAWKAFDHNTATSWGTPTGTVTGWVQLQTPTSHILRNYTVWAISDRRLTSWNVSGSNDNTTFTVLDTQTDITFAGAAPQSFPVSNTNSYTIYRLWITKMLAADSPDRAVLAELYLYELAPTPVASFTPITSTGTSPLSVSFTDTSLWTPSYWNWTIQGYGTNTTKYLNASTSQNPSFTFLQGNYTISLGAGNGNGFNISAQKSWVNVSGSTLNANFIANATTGYPNEYFQFTDTSTGSPITWDYGFGDGTANSTLQNPVHQYTAAGSYNVFLNASNSTTSSYITKQNYIVISPLPVPPAPTFTVNKSYSTSGAISVLFTVTSSAPPYMTEYDMNFGDGAWGNTSASSFSTISHTYATNGTFSPTLYVTNGAGTSSTTMPDMIVVTRPYVSLIPSPKSINIGIPANVSISAGNITHAGNVLLNVTFNKSALQVLDVYPEADWTSIAGISNSNGFVTINLSHTDYTTIPAATLANIKFNVTSTGGNTTEPLNIVASKGIIPTTSYTSGLYSFDAETPGSISPTNTTVTQTFLLVRADTGDPINYVQITNVYDGVVSGTAYTTTGSLTISSTWGYINLTSTANNFYSSQLYFIAITGDTTTVTMQPITGGLNTNIVYQAQLYQFMFQNLIGTPLSGLSVTIAPLNYTIPSKWTQQLIGISPSVNLQGSTISGITGSDGSFGAPLLTPLGYQINISGTAQSGDVVNYSIVEYPPSQGTTIIVSLPTSVTGFIQITPTPAFITYNLYNQTVNATTQTLSINFNDPTSTANLTIVKVTNQSGYVLNTTTYTGAAASNIVNNFTYIDGVTSPSGDVLSYGFSAYVSTAGGWNNISDTYDSNRGSSLTGNGTYDGWAAIIIIVLVSSAFTASTVYIGTIGVGLMGLCFYGVTKWLTPGVQGTVFVAMCIFWTCIGIIGFIAKKGRGGMF